MDRIYAEMKQSNNATDWKALIPGIDFNECGFVRAGNSIRTIHGVDIKSMMSIYEATYLYYIAKNKYTGKGAIIDLGPFLGLSTFALCRGVHHNDNNSGFSSKKVVYTFDKFMVTGQEWFSPPETITGSIFALFYQAVRNYDKNLHISPGDLLDMTWNGQPIEILFIDVSKSWRLEEHIVKTFFPHLQRGSIVVQQDYVFYGCYWIHITMELLKDYFELLDYMPHASFAYKCVKIMPELINDYQLIDKYSKKELIEIHMRAVNNAIEPVVKEILKTAHAWMLYNFGYQEQSHIVLNSIDVNVKGQSPEKMFNLQWNISAVERRIAANPSIAE